MKKISKAAFVLLMCSFLFSFSAVAEEKAGDDKTGHIDRIGEQLKEKILPESWANRVSFSGAVEAEAVYEKKDSADPDAEEEDSSDLALSKAELGIDIDIAKHVRGNVLFLYEDDEDVVVDEGFVLLDGGDVVPLYLKVGKIYVPFGRFESNMISDPLTLELGETRESAAEIGFAAGGFYAAAYVFNGDVDKDGDDSHMDNYGAALGYSLEKDVFSMDVGVGYINSLIDSNGWEDVLEEEIASAETMGLAFSFRDYVPGFVAYSIFNFGPLRIIGEYMTMLDEPEWNLSELVPGALAAVEMGAVFKGEKTSAWNAEIGCTFEIIGKETTLGLAWQGTENGEEFFPENRYMGLVSVGILEKTSLGLEYRHDEFENEDEADVLTAQLAVEF
ncbi:MAG: LbtU family siderophore porin [Desulfobacterales bacterium]